MQIFFWIRLAKRDDPEVSGRIRKCYLFPFLKFFFFTAKGTKEALRTLRSFAFMGYLLHLKKLSLPLLCLVDDRRHLIKISECVNSAMCQFAIFVQGVVVNIIIGVIGTQMTRILKIHTDFF